jgi:nicotinate-nucleotide pyrophosphorylase (carboxylating)
MKPSQNVIDRLILAALNEDAPWGDITSQTLLPADATLTAQLIAREPGVLCGSDLFRAAFTLTDATVNTRFHVADADTFAANTVLATVSGPARSILQAERVALNVVQRLSGIATLTAQYVTAVAGTKARITDTRKTTPTLRIFERYAVRCGGGHNHRFSLSDAVMVKDNHLAALGNTDITAALRRLRSELPHTTHIEVEVDRLDQLDAVLAADPDTILLDNFTLPDLRTAVTHIAGKALVEASGGVSLATVAAIAATGVDLVSVGALTHSVRALDLGLDIHTDRNIA